MGVTYTYQVLYESHSSICIRPYDDALPHSRVNSDFTAPIEYVRSHPLRWKTINLQVIVSIFRGIKSSTPHKLYDHSTDRNTIRKTNNNGEPVYFIQFMIAANVSDTFFSWFCIVCFIVVCISFATNKINPYSWNVRSLMKSSFITAFMLCVIWVYRNQRSLFFCVFCINVECEWREGIPYGTSKLVLMDFNGDFSFIRSQDERSLCTLNSIYLQNEIIIAGTHQLLLHIWLMGIW